MTNLNFLIYLNLLSISMGAIEAILYSKKAAGAFKWNEHALFVINRALIAVCLILSPYASDRVQVMTAAIFMFPLIHDGFYYVTRHLIDVPEYRFNSNSTSSTARFEIKFTWRVVLFAMGIVIYVLNFQVIEKILKNII